VPLQLLDDGNPEITARKDEFLGRRDADRPADLVIPDISFYSESSGLPAWSGCQEAAVRTAGDDGR
jgi:hypothetical protein